MSRPPYYQKPGSAPIHPVDANVITQLARQSRQKTAAPQRVTTATPVTTTPAPSSAAPARVYTAVAPLALTGTAFSIPPAATMQDGYLTQADWNTFNAKEPALGNPSVTGYVLSSTTAGVRSWIAMSGGGGGSSWLEYQIDTPPGSPSTYDDEFATNTLDAKWAVINATPGDTLRTATSNSYGPGFLVLESPYTTGDRMYGVQQDTSGLGTAPWTITAKITVDSPTNPYNGGGIFIRTSLTGNVLFFGFINNAGNLGTVPVLDVQRLDSSFNLNSEPYAGIRANGFKGYLRIVFDGTNFYCLYSATGLFSGIAGSSLVFTEAASSWIGTSAGAAGCQMYPYGERTRVMFDWFRITQP